MKIKSLKTFLLVVVTMFATVFALQARAHCYDNMTLTTNSTSPLQFDVYHVNCAAGTTGMSGRIAQVSGATGATAGVVMEIGKGNLHTAGRDTSNSAQICSTFGDVPSGYVTVPALNAGSGNYIITVSKDTTSNTTYDFSFNCIGTGFPYSPTDTTADYDQPMNH